MKHQKSKNNHFVEWFIALRYLFSKKSHSIINIISGVTLVAISVPMAAMIIVMSIYNGLDEVLKSLYSNFDAQISITPKEGKFFDREIISFDKLRAIEGVEYLTEILEDNAMIDYRSRQTIATVRGIDSQYYKTIALDSLIIRGKGNVALGDFDYAIVGVGVAYDLGINLALYDPLEFYVPKATGSSFIQTSFFNKENAKPNGVFALDEQTDSKYVITGLRFIEKLLSAHGKRSQIGISLNDEREEEDVIEDIQKIVGENFIVRNRFQQKEWLYNVMNAEKKGVFMLIVMILIIASFTLIGAVIILISDKQNSNFALKAMGATDKFIRNIFIYQGILITLGGLIIGTIFGVGFVLLQDYFGLITIDSQTLLIDSYPVKLVFDDVALIVVTVLGINGAISYITTNLVLKNKN